MNQAIANIIKGHIENLDFVDKIAGLTSVLTFEIKNKDNTVQKSFPVACCVTPEECEKNGAYNDLMPNSAYKTVIYFEDGGVSFERAESNWKYYKSNLRLVCWINIEKLTESGICKSELPCTYAAHIITEIIRALPEFPENTHGPIEKVHSEITNQLVRSPSIFSAYTYDEKHVRYLLAPFDYFALTLETTFAICMKSNLVYDATCTLKDSEGNEYNIVAVGNQIWMAENYRGVGYSYGGDSAYDAEYGKLITWAQAMAITVPGWHLPTLAEWNTLITTLGGSGIAGGYMKEAGLSHWITPNTGADNSSGFTAVGAGSKNPNDDNCGFLKSYAFFWASTEIDVTQASFIYLSFDDDNCVAMNNGIKLQGFSVRLIKD